MTAQTDPTIDRIDAGTLERLRRDDPDVRILDVRMGSEFEAAHIAGSYNVPLDTLAEHVEEFARVEHPVVLVCQSGNRARQAHTKLADAGKEPLHLLDGGMVAWTAAGGDVVLGEKSRWALDRQVRLMAGTIVLAMVALSALVPWTKWIAAAVGAMLIYVAVADRCPVTPFFARLPYNRAKPCNVDDVLTALGGRTA